jgi:hypothetical protein
LQQLKKKVKGKKNKNFPQKKTWDRQVMTPFTCPFPITPTTLGGGGGEEGTRGV